MTDYVLARNGLAHDINGLMARASLIAEELITHSDTAVASRAMKIERAIEEVAEICRRELSAHRDDVETVMDADDVDRLINQVVQLVGLESNLARRPVDFFISTEPEVVLFTDRTALFRILFNLALNAANAIAAHGGSYIEISVMTAWGRVYIDVADDGPGLPQHAIKFLSPSFAGDGKTPTGPIGTGLANAASLARSAGGELTLVRSSPSGAQFCLMLPTADGSNVAGGQLGADEDVLGAIILAE